MQTKDVITLLVSCSALAVSIITFYLQRIRRKDRLIARLIRSALSDGEWNRLDEYSISNVGDTQVVVKSAGVEMRFKDDPSTGFPRKIEAKPMPFVIVPNEIVIVSVIS